MQILSVANVLKPEAEEMIWKYFENTMVPIITKYQLEPMEAQVDLTKEVKTSSVFCVHQLHSSLPAL